jgi:hypothetical protein
MNKKNYEMILIESSKRENGSSTEFNFKFQRPITNVQEIELLYASLNNTFYTFSSKDEFVFTETFLPRWIDIDVDGVMSRLLIPPGPNVTHKFNFQDSSLSVDEFVDYIKENMNLLSETGTYDVIYDVSKFQMTIFNIDADYKKFSLDFSSANSIYKKGGFEQKVYDFSNSFTSEKSMSLNSSEYILVNINKIGSHISTKNGTGVFFIPSQSLRGDLISFNASSNFRQIVDTTNLQLSDIIVQVLDENGSILLSDSEINLKLLLKCYRSIPM